jgi:hypothetical protein
MTIYEDTVLSSLQEILNYQQITKYLFFSLYNLPLCYSVHYPFQLEKKYNKIVTYNCLLCSEKLFPFVSRIKPKN